MSALPRTWLPGGSAQCCVLEPFSTVTRTRPWTTASPASSGRLVTLSNGAAQVAGTCTGPPVPAYAATPSLEVAALPDLVRLVTG